MTVPPTLTANMVLCCRQGDGNDERLPMYVTMPRRTRCECSRAMGMLM